MQDDSLQKQSNIKEVDVFNTLVDAVKFSFREKPMWKFIIKYYAPAFFAFGTILFTLATLLLFPFIEADVPETVFSDPSFIGFMVCIGIIVLVFTLFHIAMTVIVITGSIVHTWGIEVQASKLKNEDIFESLVRKKATPVFVFYLTIYVIYFVSAFVLWVINMIIPVAFVLFIPLALILYAILTSIPNIMYKNTSFHYTFTMTKEYITKHFWKLVFAGFLTNVSRSLITSIFGSVIQIGIMLSIFGFSAIFQFLIESSIPILSSFSMGLFFSLIATLASTLSLFLLSIEQNYYTMLFCRFNNFSYIASQEQAYETI